jgi:hypothetical protein
VPILGDAIHLLGQSVDAGIHLALADTRADETVGFNLMEKPLGVVLSGMELDQSLCFELVQGSGRIHKCLYPRPNINSSKACQMPQPVPGTF